MGLEVPHGVGSCLPVGECSGTGLSSNEVLDHKVDVGERLAQRGEELPGVLGSVDYIGRRRRMDDEIAGDKLLDD